MRSLAIPAILLSLGLSACVPARSVTSASPPLVIHAEWLVTALASAGEAERRLGSDRVSRGRRETTGAGGSAVVTEIVIDGGRSRLRFRESRPETSSLEITVDRLEWRHVIEILGETSSGVTLPTAGHVSGRARFDRGAAPRADFDLVSHFDADGERAEITVRGGIDPDSLSLDAGLSSTGPALSRLLFDLFRGDTLERLVRVEGPIEASLTIRLNGADRSPLYRGSIRFARTDLVFPQEGLALRGLEGTLPLRPSSGRVSRESAAISLRGIDFRGVELADVRALGRMDPGALYLESMSFRFAGGAGRGALIANLPDLSGSRAAFFGVVKGFEASELGRLVIDDTGCLAGSADATIELQTVRSRLVKFRADVTLETGTAARPLDALLSLVMPELFRSSETSSTWPVSGARFSLVLDPRYYDAPTVRRKFGADGDTSDLGEIVGRLQFTTSYRPHAVAPDNARPARPFDALAVPVNMLMENIQMRLFRTRIARILEAAGRASPDR